jgi:hypothetical protein
MSSTTSKARPAVAEAVVTGENGAVRLGRSLAAALLAGATAVLLSASAVGAEEGREAVALRGFVGWGSLVSFPERDLGYLVTPSGGVRKSRDGGRTWRRIGSVPPLVAVDFGPHRLPDTFPLTPFALQDVARKLGLGHVGVKRAYAMIRRARACGLLRDAGH